MTCPVSPVFSSVFLRCFLLKALTPHPVQCSAHFQVRQKYYIALGIREKRQVKVEGEQSLLKM